MIKKRVRKALKDLDSLALDLNHVSRLTEEIKTGFEFNVFSWKSTQGEITGKILKSEHVDKLSFVDDVYSKIG